MCGADMLKALYRAAEKPQTGVTLRSMVRMCHHEDRQAKLIDNARWLYRELPVRLARRAVELEKLPHGLSEKAGVKLVRNWYVQSFADIVRCTEPVDAATEHQFTESISVVKNRHAATMNTMAHAIRHLRQERSAIDARLDAELCAFLDRFYLSRIGIRVLIGHHVAMHQTDPSTSGLIASECRPSEVCVDAAEDARATCLRTYGDSPEVTIVGQTDLVFPYIPSHMHHTVFELVKNSLRATIDFHGLQASLPPVKIIISAGKEDVVIKISDEGGGIPRSASEQVWSYFFTTSDTPVQVSAAETPVFPHDFSNDNVMSGFGYGLPISRLYARYFGGDLQIVCMEGYGTDAYVHFNRLGEKDEPLP